MVVLYFSCNFDVVVWRGEPCLPTLPLWPEVTLLFYLNSFIKFTWCSIQSQDSLLVLSFWPPNINFSTLLDNFYFIHVTSKFLSVSNFHMPPKLCTSYTYDWNISSLTCMTTIYTVSDLARTGFSWPPLCLAMIRLFMLSKYPYILQSRPVSHCCNCWFSCLWCLVHLWTYTA